MNREKFHVMSKRRNGSPRIAVTIRVPAEVLKKIDAAIDQRVIPLSRNNWLIEAAVEKLSRKSSGGRNGAE
jgi:hypothetical protein